MNAWSAWCSGTRSCSPALEILNRKLRDWLACAGPPIWRASGRWASSRTTGRAGRGPAPAVDFGGGTFDAAVLSGGRVTALRGTPVGGERLDQVIFETRVGPELGLDALPSWLFNEMRSLSGVGLLLADPGLPFLLERFGGPAARTARAIFFEGHAHDFYRSVEGAKIALSAQESEPRRTWAKYAGCVRSSATIPSTRPTPSSGRSAAARMT